MSRRRDTDIDRLVALALQLPGNCGQCDQYQVTNADALLGAELHNGGHGEGELGE